MDKEQDKIRKDIAAQVKDLSKHGGSPNFDAVKALADRAGGRVVSSGYNEHGEPLYFVGYKQGGYIKKYAKGGGVRKARY